MAMGLFDWLKGKGSQQSCLEAIAPAPLETSSSNVVNVIAPAPLNKSSSENDDFEGVYRQGLAELEAGNYERALMFFERAIVINGNQAEVWTKRAVALQNLNRIEEAIEANQRAITLIKGNQLLATNNFLDNSTQSKVEFSPSIPEPVINLDDAEKWFENGNSLYFEGRYQEAIASYDHALKFKPDDHYAWIMRGIALKDLGRNEEAITSYDNALKIKPDDHIAWIMRGLALFNLGRNEEAIASYDEAVKIKPDYYEAWNRRGVALSNLGRMEEAIASYDKAVKIKPDKHPAWLCRGWALWNLGRNEEAIASCDSALKIKPDDYLAWIFRGLALSNLGRNEEAIASFDNALKIKPDDHEAWYNRGIALADLGRLEEAITSFDNALKFKPDMHEAWYGQGFALRSLGRLEEAIASYDRALTLTRGKYWQAWINRASAIAQLVKKRTFVIHSLPLEMQHPDLEKPGYEGELACLREGLKYVERAADPEGWGELHRSTGLAHYYYARGQENPASFWRKAVPCYQTALEALTKDQFPTAHLETLQDLIRVLTALKNTETAQTLLRKGTDLLERLLNQKTGAAKDQFERQFRPVFNELTVALAVQTGDWPTALKIAEQDKNALLRQGLLSNQPAQSPDYGQMQTFLQQQPHTAILYWHLSANALTTFLLTGAQVEAITSDFSQLIALETWINTWKDDYPTDKKKTSENSTKFPQNSSKSGLIPPNPPSKGGNRAEVQDVSIVFSGKTVIIQNKRESEASNSVINNSPQTSTPPFLREADGNNSIIDNSPQTSTPPFLREADGNNSIIDNSPQTSTPPFLRGAGGINPKNEAGEINSVINDSSQTSTPPFLRGAGGINPQNETDRINSTWRDRLHQSLKNLKNLLSIPEIETKLAQFPQINRLILIPHRDLHLFPLDSLFTNQYTISYLPSIQVGINLLAHPTNPENRLLSIENPDSIQTNDDGTVTKFPPLTAAEAESELICRMYSNSTRRDKTETTLNEVTVQLTQPYSIMIKMDDDNFNALFSRDLENRNHSYRNIPHNVLHFTGHGYYDFGRPMNSALALSQRDRLTLTQIIKLNLSFYDLACLCACETAIAGNQTITTEYIGIVSAFLYAGVAKVVSTLWTVESVASAVLMVEFHHRRLTGKPENQALSEAKHWLRTASVAELSRWYQQQMDALPDDHSLRPWLCDRLDELATMKSDSIPYESPYFWAAFTLTGL
jgi:tetratricopeptide (TPR) repeat protein